jgi:hypothetical protein
LRHKRFGACELSSISRDRWRTYVVVSAIDNTFLPREVSPVADESDEIRTAHLLCAVAKLLGTPSVLNSLVSRAIELPVPLTDLGRGIRDLYRHNSRGHDSYLFGTYRQHGWWYFFPVVLSVKTPIGFSVLALAGIGTVLFRWRLSPWQHCLTALFPFAILLSCMSSQIDAGVRHILPVYPLLALLGGHAISLSVKNPRWPLAAMASILLVFSVVAESWRAHPDYLAYFNPLAGNHPETILAESDLDWGQDLHRLSQRLKFLGVKQDAIRYFGSAPLEKADLPEYRALLPDQPATGYIAISVRYLALEYAKDGSYGWLRSRPPLEKIGKSIYLFRLAE